jgi:hypothetical protein
MKTPSDSPLIIDEPPIILPDKEHKGSVAFPLDLSEDKCAQTVVGRETVRRLQADFAAYHIRMERLHTQRLSCLDSWLLRSMSKSGKVCEGSDMRVVIASCRYR